MNEKVSLFELKNQKHSLYFAKLFAISLLQYKLNVKSLLNVLLTYIDIEYNSLFSQSIEEQKNLEKM